MVQFNPFQAFVPVLYPLATIKSVAIKWEHSQCRPFFKKNFGFPLHFWKFCLPPALPTPHFLLIPPPKCKNVLPLLLKLSNFCC